MVIHRTLQYQYTRLVYRRGQVGMVIHGALDCQEDIRVS